jgi:hypothetical protein
MFYDYQEIFLVTYGIELKDLAYLAGLVDGEGNIDAQVKQRQTGVALRISNSNRAVLEWVKQKFGGKIYRKQEKCYKHKHWVWILGGKKALPLFKALQPLLKIKAAEVRVAIEMLEYLHSRGGNVREAENYFRFLRTKALEIQQLKQACKIQVN